MRERLAEVEHLFEAKQQIRSDSFEVKHLLSLLGSIHLEKWQTFAISHCFLLRKTLSVYIQTGDIQFCQFLLKEILFAQSFPTQYYNSATPQALHDLCNFISGLFLRLLLERQIAKRFQMLRKSEMGIDCDFGFEVVQQFVEDLMLTELLLVDDQI